MSQWCIKEISKMSGVSVQTLYHYDRIQLLKPSKRLENGYRVYSDKDLLKLNQIIALKIFGFELSQIKSMLDGEHKTLENFSLQAQLLEEKALSLLNSSKTLKSIVTSLEGHDTVSSKTILDLLEIYSMPHEIQDSLDQLNVTLKSCCFSDKAWFPLIEEVKAAFKQNPEAEEAIHLARDFTQKLHKDFGKNFTYFPLGEFQRQLLALDKKFVLTSCVIVWLEKAVTTYWTNRILCILNQVGQIPQKMVYALWNNVLDDMYGDGELEKKQTVTHMVLSSDSVDENAKVWLRTLPSFS
jgi:DNA-binding transcriptional MerR regulator